MLDTMVGGVACCHGVKDHHGDGPWIKVTCCHGVKDHHDDGSWIIMRLVPYHGSEDTMGGEGWWRPPMGPAELDAMVGYETAGVPNHGSSKCWTPWWAGWPVAMGSKTNMAMGHG